MRAVVFGAPFPPFSIQLIAIFSVLAASRDFCTTYMGIEDLDLSESRVSDNNACSRLAHKPVSAENV